MKLSLILEARETGSRAIRSLRQHVLGLGRDAKTAARGLDMADRAIVRAERSGVRLGRAMRRIGSDAVAGSRRAIGGLIALERRLQLTRKQAVGLATWTGRKLGEGLRFGALAATGGAMAALYKIGSSGMAFEKYRTQLTGLEGSRAAGNKAMGWVQDFAKTTPYELDQVMSAFIALKAYGIDPTDGSLRTLGDTAAGMGKDLMQAVEMMADAQTGEFERLKEFGIRASLAGEKVTFKFMRNGKEMTRTVKKQGAEIQRELMAIFAERFGGGMDALALTTEGKFSNLMDRITLSAKKVWEGGLGSAVNRVLDDIAGSLDQMEKDGSLDLWAAKTAKGLGDLVGAAGSFNWKGFASDVASIASAFGSVASTVNAAGNALDRVGKYAQQGGLKGSLYNPFLSAETKRNNRRQLRVLNKQLGYDRNFGIPEGQIEEDHSIAAGRRNAKAQRDYWEARRTGRAKPAPWEQQRLAPTPNWAAPGRAPLKPAAAPTGKISLLIKTDPGVSARTTGMQATGVRLEVNTGRSMGSIV